MTGKPSPAPWVVLNPYTNRSVYPIAIKLPVPDENAFWIIGEFNSQGGTPEQCRANADLAAAAPQLLAQLEALADQVRALELIVPPNVLKAIARARGQA